MRYEEGPGTAMLISRIPWSLPGTQVAGLPDDVKALYEEVRRSHSADAYTAAALALRKLLMHVAVEKGAKPDQSFVAYVEFLDKNHYLGHDGKPWVDMIRKRGNEANHEITLMTEEDSDHLMSLAEMLLKLVYEFPGRLDID
jgi:hypothetical protein